MAKNCYRSQLVVTLGAARKGESRGIYIIHVLCAEFLPCEYLCKCQIKWAVFKKSRNIIIQFPL